MPFGAFLFSRAGQKYELSGVFPLRLFAGVQIRKGRFSMCARQWGPPADPDASCREQPGAGSGLRQDLCLCLPYIS